LHGLPLWEAVLLILLRNIDSNGTDVESSAVCFGVKVNQSNPQKFSSVDGLSKRELSTSLKFIMVSPHFFATRYTPAKARIYPIAWFVVGIPPWQR
jgi:hypothetical protein